jgi:hypothetical protein
VFNAILNRNILVAASAAVLLYGIAIAPENAAARKELGVPGRLQNADCGVQGNAELPVIRIVPAGTIPERAPVSVLLGTEQNGGTA